MKSTSQARAARRAAKSKWNKPISEKAYNGFRERIISVHHLLGYDPNDMLRMLNEYLSGNKNTGGWACLADKMAFMMMRPEIDKAMERSARARERARMRRERKLAEQTEPKREPEAETIHAAVEPAVPSVIVPHDVPRTRLNGHERPRW